MEIYSLPLSYFDGIYIKDLKTLGEEILAKVEEAA
jgi:hypothetical protein